MHNFSLKINKLEIYFRNFFKINPHKHWTVLVNTFLFLVLILILFSLFFLYKIKNEKIFQVTTDQKVTQALLKESLLFSITEFYDSRVINTEKINNSTSLYKDPSI